MQILKLKASDYENNFIPVSITERLADAVQGGTAEYIPGGTGINEIIVRVRDAKTEQYIRHGITDRERCEDCQNPIDPAEICQGKMGETLCPGCAD